MAQSTANWTMQASAFPTPRAIRDIDITSATNAWAIGFDLSAASAPVQDFTRTTNGGTTWTSGTIPNIPTWEFSNISAVDANTAWVAFFNNVSSTNQSGGRIYKTTDGGLTWTQQATTAFTSPSSFLNIVHMFDANNGWAQGDPVNGEFEMYTTTNGGTTWTQVPGANIPNPLSTSEYGTVDVYTTVGNNVIYFGTNAGRVFKSTDGGLNWTVTANTTLTGIDNLAFRDANNGIITEGSDMMRTTNGGTTWTQVAYTGDFYGYDLKFVPGTGNTYVSTGASTAPGSGSSYSKDGGNTWVAFDNLPLLAVDFLNPTVGFAGSLNSSATVGGIFKFNGTVISGINNSEFSKAVMVYPNPSNGVFAIEMPASSESVATINVTDALGRVVYNKTEKLNGAYNGQIDLSNLGNGIYMLNIKTGENISLRKLVIE